MRQHELPKSGRGERDTLRQFERGEDESFEFTVVIGPLVIMIMLIAFATVARTELMPAFSAASECARAAITTYDPATGQEQGEQVARGILASNYVNADSPSTHVEVSGDEEDGIWPPDTPVTCSVSYQIDVSGIPFFAEMTGGFIPISSSVTLHTERNTSRWPTPAPP